MNGMTVQEAAAYHGVHIQTIYQYIWCGRITGRRIGKRLYLLDEQSVTSLDRRPAGRPRKTA